MLWGEGKVMGGKQKEKKRKVLPVSLALFMGLHKAGLERQTPERREGGDCNLTQELNSLCRTALKAKTATQAVLHSLATSITLSFAGALGPCNYACVQGR